MMVAMMMVTVRTIRVTINDNDAYDDGDGDDGEA